jgi:hypothetical protein
MWLVEVMKLDVHKIDTYDNTPLMVAFDSNLQGRINSLDSARWLMRNGVGIDDIVDHVTGRTAIMKAYDQHSWDIVSNLLEHTDADVHVIDHTHNTIWDMIDSDSCQTVPEMKSVLVRFVLLRQVPTTFKHKYRRDTIFQQFIKKGEIIQKRIKAYKKVRNKLIVSQLSIPTNIPNVITDDILLTNDELWNLGIEGNKRKR